MICVSIGSESPAEAKRILQKSGFIELRADLLQWKMDDYRDVILAGNKTVFTCRPGEYSPKERLELFEAAAIAGATYLDVEIESDEIFLDSVRNISNLYSSELIVSYHNYEMTPSIEILESRLNECYQADADVAKIACRVYSPADAARLLSLYNVSGRKVVLGMGKAGKITRIAAPLLGAEFTFASSGEGEATAEGQLTFSEMKEIIKKIQ
jgi:3-dehydroquinate dehydratase type I